MIGSRGVVRLHSTDFYGKITDRKGEKNDGRCSMIILSSTIFGMIGMLIIVTAHRILPWNIVRGYMDVDMLAFAYQCIPSRHDVIRKPDMKESRVE